MKKILIVDDQPSIRTVLELTLKDRFSIDQADNADTAYQRVLAERPAALVLDVMMPGSMNGYQLCELIKRDAELAAIHVVMISARGQVKDQEFGLSLGADAYFVKPFSPLALLHHLESVLLQTGLMAPVARAASLPPSQPSLSKGFEMAWMHSPWAMLAIDLDGNVGLASPAFERSCGIGTAALKGLSEAGLKALLDACSIENTRVATSAGDWRAIYYLPPPAKDEQQLTKLAALLREPLASIFGFAELLLTQDYAEDLRLQLTATLLDEIEAMSNILNEKLNLSPPALHR